MFNRLISAYVVVTTFLGVIRTATCTEESDNEDGSCSSWSKTIVVRGEDIINPLYASFPDVRANPEKEEDFGFFGGFGNGDYYRANLPIYSRDDDAPDRAGRIIGYIAENFQYLPSGDFDPFPECIGTGVFSHYNSDFTKIKGQIMDQSSCNGISRAIVGGLGKYQGMTGRYELVEVTDDWPQGEGSYISWKLVLNCK